MLWTNNFNLAQNTCIFITKKKVAQRGFHICLLLVLLATSTIFIHTPDAFIHPVDKYLLNVYCVVDEMQGYISKHERQNSEF